MTPKKNNKPSDHFINELIKLIQESKAEVGTDFDEFISSLVPSETIGIPYTTNEELIKALKGML